MNALHTVARTRRALLAAGFCLALGVLAAAFGRAARRMEDLPCQTAGMRLDVNAAGMEELALLPAVGPALAKAIVADRQARGAFESVEALQRVKGIGPRKWAQMKPWVKVR